MFHIAAIPLQSLPVLRCRTLGPAMFHIAAIPLQGHFFGPIFWQT
jgi:hypothetical protein